MILAESLYDPEVHVEDKSRLVVSLSDLQQDRFAQAYFDAFADGQTPESSNLIKVWIRICRFRWRGTTVGAGQRMTTADLHDMGRKARSIVNRCATDHNIQNILPQGLIPKLQTQTSDPEIGMFDSVLQAISGPVEAAFMSFLSSQFFLKYQIDIMTKGHITLSDVLFYDGTLFYFLDFMEQEGMRKYADFLLIMHSYRNADPGQVDSHAIWKKFFHNSSGELNSLTNSTDECTHCLLFSKSVCSRVMQEMLSEQPNCFDFPARLLHQYLERTYFKQFLESQAYFDVTTEFIKSFQGMQIQFDSPTPRCKSIDEVSEPGSTLSAGPSSDVMTDLPCSTTDTTATAACCEKNGAATSSSDDQIWNRSGSGTLQIVHVDRYGRVISDLEPEPTDRRQERSNISKSIRKLVARSVSNQDSNQALAWKVAQMIIDDVVNVTQEYT